MGGTDHGGGSTSRARFGGLLSFSTRHWRPLAALAALLLVASWAGSGSLRPSSSSSGAGPSEDLTLLQSDMAQQGVAAEEAKRLVERAANAAARRERLASALRAAANTPPPEEDEPTMPPLATTPVDAARTDAPDPDELLVSHPADWRETPAPTHAPEVIAAFEQALAEFRERVGPEAAARAAQRTANRAKAAADLAARQAAQVRVRGAAAVAAELAQHAPLVARRARGQPQPQPGDKTAISKEDEDKFRARLEEDKASGRNTHLNPGLRGVAPADAFRAHAAPKDKEGNLLPLQAGELRAPTVEVVQHARGSLRTQLAWHLADLGREQAVVLLFHGCGCSATDWFERPEDRLVTTALVHAGFSVLAFSSQDRSSKCWSESWPPLLARGAEGNEDVNSVLGALALWLHREDKNDVPLLALGASSGGTFVTILARAMFLTAAAVLISPGYEAAMHAPPAYAPAAYRQKFAHAMPPVLDPRLLADAHTLFNLPPLAMLIMPRDKQWATLRGAQMAEHVVEQLNPWLQPAVHGWDAVQLWAVERQAVESDLALRIPAVKAHPQGKQCAHLFHAFLAAPNVHLREAVEYDRAEALASGLKKQEDIAATGPPPDRALTEDGSDMLALDPRQFRLAALTLAHLDAAKGRSYSVAPLPAVDSTASEQAKKDHEAAQARRMQQMTGTSAEDTVLHARLLSLGLLVDDASLFPQLLHTCSTLLNAQLAHLRQLLAARYAYHEMTSVRNDELVAFFHAALRDDRDQQLRAQEQAIDDSKDA